MKFVKPTKKAVAEYIIIGLILIAMAMMIFSFSNRELSYSQYNTSALDHVRGKVIEVLEEDLSYDNEYVTGKQTVLVEIRQGEFKGQKVEIVNPINSTHNVVVKEGSRVIVRVDSPQVEAEPLFNIYNYDRTFGTLFLVIFFIVIVVMIGRKKGVMSCIGLLFTVCTVICYLLPEVFEGKNAVLVSLVTVIISTAVSCFCISGLEKKTYLNIISTAIGTLSAGAVFCLFMWILNISGTTIPEVEELTLISKATGLQLKGIMFSGILISALGAVMDVAVSMGASLHEIKEVQPEITAKALFKSGMNIGRDMIGTMTNTLILAFAGSSLASMVILLSLGIQFNQLLSSDFLAMELATGIAGSSAVVLTVPISAAVFSYSTKNNKK